MKFDSFWPTRLLFGRGRFRDAGRLAAALGARALVLSTRRAMAALGYTDRLLSDLARHGVEAELAGPLQGTPTTDEVDRLAEQARAFRADLIVALGGGSVLDAAKATAGVAPGTARCADLLHGKAEISSALPVLAIPTTSGTASETNRAAIVTDPALPHKDALRSDHLFPALALVDPELTYALPAHVTALTGFDALAHATESYVSPRAQPLADGLALAAVAAVARWLPVALAEPENPEAREHLAWASTSVGYNLSCVGTCLPHRLDKPLCAFHPDLAHAQAVAFFYPAWAEHGWHGYPERFARLAALLEPDLAAEPVERQAQAFARVITSFLSSIGLNRTPAKPLRVSAGEASRLAERVTGDTRINPVPVEKHELASFYLRVLR